MWATTTVQQINATEEQNGRNTSHNLEVNIKYKRRVIKNCKYFRILAPGNEEEAGAWVKWREVTTCWRWEEIWRREEPPKRHNPRLTCKHVVEGTEPPVQGPLHWFDLLPYW